MYENKSLAAARDTALCSFNGEFLKSEIEASISRHSSNPEHHRQPHGIRSPDEPWTTPEAESTLYGDFQPTRILFPATEVSPEKFPLEFVEDQHWRSEKSETEYKEWSELKVPQWFNLHYTDPSYEQLKTRDSDIKMEDHITRWLREQTCDDAVKRRRKVTRSQRQAANERERRRMNSLNVAFENLRAIIPVSTNQRRLSRIQTLRFAIDYIALMTEILKGEGVRKEQRGKLVPQRVMTSSVVAGKSSSAGSTEFRTRRRVSKRKGERL